MSSRQPVVPITANKKNGKNFRGLSMLTGYLRNRAWLQALEKLAGALRVVLGIGSKHDQEKAVLAGQHKTRHMEYRVVRHGQAIEREHTEDRRKRAEQDRHSESHNDKR